MKKNTVHNLLISHDPQFEKNASLNHPVGLHLCYESCWWFIHVKFPSTHHLEWERLSDNFYQAYLSLQLILKMIHRGFKTNRHIVT